jgi:hypothetical protein
MLLRKVELFPNYMVLQPIALPKACHLDVVRGPSIPHDLESDAG